MSDSPFAYNRMTLDELRSLAASPQVGTIQAMPQSFRALADRIGDVADLLAHVQRDLPHWWKGPAADQAAATLGRAATEAREFHDSALGAATAVGRCAQIVAEQQHQMMNVPELPEPGITDVVQRPATPFEALEAMRQDAAYQAAHEQAVQVVNGIAAQYVETRSQLSNIGTFRAENFTPLEPALPAASNAEATFGENAHSVDLGKTRSIQRRKSQGGSPTGFGNARKLSAKERIPASTETPKSAYGNIETPVRDAEIPRQASREADNGDAPRGAGDSLPYQSPWPAFAVDNDTTAQSVIRGAPPINEDKESTTFRTEWKPEDGLLQMNLEQGPGNFFATNHFGLGVASRTSSGTTRMSSRSAHGEGRPANALHVSDDIARDSSTSQLASHLSVNHPDLSSEYSGIVPPYNGVGTVHRTREERNPRPAYLKERKSTWVFDKVAAPADGVITPDWLEHS